MTAFSRSAKIARRKRTKGPNWLELPGELTAKILHKLGAFEIFTTARPVCPLWRKICMDPLMWRTIDLTNYPLYPRAQLVKFSRYAIERSCGHLEDISIEDFGTDEILKDIAKCGSRVIRLQLLNCKKVTYEGLREAMEKLPMLEELEISLLHISNATLEFIGKCCPHLKLLKFNMKQDEKGYIYDEEAFAIAKTMPELRHLQLMGCKLSNEGLRAILEGCPHLEPLNPSVCSNVDLSGDLSKKCVKMSLSEIAIFVEECDLSEQLDYEDYYECSCDNCVRDSDDSDNEGPYDDFDDEYAYFRRLL